MKRLISLTTLLLVIASGVVRADQAGDEQAITVSELPLELAIKQVRGNGNRVFFSFEDPNCVYCKQMAADIVAMTDVTIYTFLYPILSDDSTEKAKAIWCSADRKKAWTGWMINGIAPVAAKCDTGAIDKLAALGRKLKVRGTPTVFLADGERISGAVPAMVLEMAISSPRVLSYQADREKALMSTPGRAL